MEVTNQMLESVRTAQLTQSVQSQQQTRSGQSTDFDELLQQKQQESAPAAKPTDKQAVQEKEVPRETAEKPQAEEEKEDIPEDAKAVLAAMMLQPQQAEQAEVVKIEETAAPELVVEAVEAPVEAPEAEAAPETVQTAWEAPAQRTGTADAPVETAEAPRQERIEQAPEAVEAPRQEASAETVEAPRQTAERTVEVVERPRQAAEDADETDEAPAEVPLFGEAETAIPVKVAEPVLNPQRPVPIESEEAPRELADILTRSVEQDNTIGVIQMTPENLGPVTMTLTRGEDGAIHMVLEALNPKTAALLEKHAVNIQNIAAENTRQEVRVEIKSETDQMLRDNWTEDRDGQKQQQEQQQRPQEEHEAREDFLHRLRLGLTGDDENS